MYNHFYGFSIKPFNVTPDPRFLYPSETHREALTSIIYGIQERKGFIAIIGEAGTGKTTLLNAALENLRENLRSAFIFNTSVKFNEMLQMILMELGLANAEEKIPRFAALDRLNRYATEQYAQGKNIAVIIDEAQHLTSGAMENLRLISNLETGSHKLIQIVLSGQPELDEKLGSPTLRQLAQRINVKRHIVPMGKKDTFKYINHNLMIVGYKGGDLFDKKSLRLIWRYSHGIPRNINILCDNALLIGYGLGKKKIRKHIVREAIRDLSPAPYTRRGASIRLMPAKKNISPVFLKNNFIKRLAFTSIVIILALAGIGLTQDKISQKWKLAADMQYLWATIFDEYYQKWVAADEKPRHANYFTIESDSADRAEKSSSSEKEEIGNPAPKITQRKTEVELPMNLDFPPTSGKSQQATVEMNRWVVKNGDCLFNIIQKIYGDQAHGILPLVLEQNPGIQDPNFIVPGQVICMPGRIRANLLSRGE